MASSPQGDTVPYFVMTPPHECPAIDTRCARYPRRPAYRFGNSFFHEFQVLARRLHRRLRKPGGSTSYDYDYASELEGDWGNAMFADEMAVLDDVARRPDVDMSRAVVSVGVRRVRDLWMISHTNRFRAALAERPSAICSPNR